MTLILIPMILLVFASLYVLKVEHVTTVAFVLAIPLVAIAVSLSMAFIALNTPITNPYFWLFLSYDVFLGIIIGGVLHFFARVIRFS